MDAHKDLDPHDVGQGKTHNDITEKYDSVAGTYKNNIDQVPTEDRIGTAQMPLAPDPSPFVVGPLGK